MIKKIFNVIVVLSIIIFLFNFSAWAVPYLINYQGKLTDPNGIALNDDFQISFSLYTTARGGTPLWSEIQSVTVYNGVYNIQLGVLSPFPRGIFDNDSLYLEVEIEGEILSPRQRITSTAYAIKSASIDINSITTNMIIDNAVTGNKIADGAVGPSDLADNAVTSAKIVDGTIQQADLSFSLPDGHSLDAHDGDPKDVVYVDDYGNVGIGTTNPICELEVVDNNMNAKLCYSYRSGSGATPDTFYYHGITGKYGNETVGYLGRQVNKKMSDCWKYGVYGSATGDGSLISKTRNYGVYGEAYGGTENWAGYFSGDVHASGNVGIGTKAPRTSLEIVGTGIRLVDVDLYSFNDYGNISFKDSGGGGLVLNSYTDGSWADMSFQTNGTTKMFIESGGNVGIGTMIPQDKLDVAGTVRCQTLTVTGGADLAEPFNIKDKDIIKPGMVLIIDPENPGQLKISEKPYDHCVAGIVSGAGKINPGMIMGQSASIADGRYPVALTGRVYCMADASNGSIKPGDLLTTSMTPGHAMRVSEYSRAQGAVLGKAMSSLESGQGLILVLVALQ